MKHYTVLGLIVLVMALMVIVPVTAADMTTVVSIKTGAANPPVVLAKWETEQGTPYLESGDIQHKTIGSQFMPSGVYETSKRINYYAIVTDDQANGHVKEVAAEVWHPTGPNVGLYKYQIHFREMTKDEGKAALKAVWDPANNINLGLITTPCDCRDLSVKTTTTTCLDLVRELDKGTSSVWVGEADITYHQMNGNYFVEVIAWHDDVASIPLWNTFYYTPLTAVEYDFNNVDYKEVQMLQPVWRSGDTNFATGDGSPTVRNIGNTKAQFTIQQSDMNFKKDVNGVWNILFDARLGHMSDNEPYYNPFEEHTLLDVLDRCNTDELDFSIHIIKPTRYPEPGTMKLSVKDPEYEQGSFTYCEWLND